MADISPNARKRVLSGMRPTGKLHLGNYMGALHNWVKLQNELDEHGQPRYECYFFIADWHALTTDYANPGRIKQNTLDVALDFLAAGLDPDKSTIFIQSHVPQHAELHLLLSMITPLSWLERVPSYKDQQEQLREKDLTTYGFLGYPLLQSADILLYQPQFVPVGQDQVAHVEITREIARRFNSMYRTVVFPEPQALLTPSPKLPGIDGRKMSKSYGNTISLSDDPAVVQAKIQSMSTNGQRIVQADPGNPDLCPVGDLHKVFSPQEVIAETQHGCRTASIGCDFCKLEAARSVCAITEPISEARRKYESRIDDTWELLRAQASKAARRAEETLLLVRTALNVTADIGSIRRHFTASAGEGERSRNLSRHADWWLLPGDQLTRQLRDYWFTNLVPSNVALTQESNRVFASLERQMQEPFLTAKKKRVFVAVSRELEPGVWHFEIPAKTFEIWVLLCWNAESYLVDDFVLPQKIYSGQFARAKKSAIDARVQAVVRRQDDGFLFSLANSEEVDISGLLSEYEPLG